MKKAKASVWNNKWDEIFDFTPNRTGKKNFRVSYEQNRDFVFSYDFMQSIVTQVEGVKRNKAASLKGNHFDN